MPAGTTEYERECKYFDINGRQKRGMPQRGDPHHHPEVPKESFFRRELPKHCISFSSDEGKKLFREALGEGFMENYFTLAAQYRTQSEPAFCGLGTLTMALNALSIDPGRVWKGPWRWFSEEMLDCCTSLELVKKQGITLGQFVCLARCNGAQASVFYGSDSDEATFRNVVETTSKASEFVTIVSYNRGKVGQTGTGHFSPIGGYHPRKDMVLLMEVARFKYPPHWIPLSMLFEATKDVDAVTGRSRGFVTLSPSQEFCFWCSNNVPKQ